jgi:hypothetical protein
MLLALERIENSDHIRDQLRSVHHQLEGLHGLYRKSETGLPPDSTAPLSS